MYTKQISHNNWRELLNVYKKNSHWMYHLNKTEFGDVMKIHLWSFFEYKYFTTSYNAEIEKKLH